MNPLRWTLLGIAAAGSLVVEWALTYDHAHDAWWNWIPAFFALFGFFGCLLIIVFAKWLGKRFLRKREDYYDAD